MHCLAARAVIISVIDQIFFNLLTPSAAFTFKMIIKSIFEFNCENEREKSAEVRSQLRSILSPY